MRAEETAYVLRTLYGKVCDCEVINGPVVASGMLAEDPPCSLSSLVPSSPQSDLPGVFRRLTGQGVQIGSFPDLIPTMSV